MNRPERQQPKVISEEKTTGHFLLANNADDRILMSSEQLPEGGRQYSITGFLPLEREAITTIMSTPLHLPDVKWTEVSEGLRKVAYPSRKIQNLARSAVHRADLSEVKPVARELADIMQNNQDYRTYTVNMPVFTPEESQKYTSEELRMRMSTGKLIGYLKSKGLDPRRSEQFRNLIKGSTADAIDLALERAMGFSNQEILEMQNSVLLEEAGSAVELEVLYELHARLFFGFRRQATYDDLQIKGGGYDTDIFVRQEDMPDAILPVINSTNVSIGPLLPDVDRTTGQPRRRTTFYTQRPRIVANPRLVWVNQDGERSFRFPVSRYPEHVVGEFWQRIPRPSSLLGAALAANYFSQDKSIDYLHALQERLGDRGRHLYREHRLTRFPVAGLLPLVIKYEQTKLLDDDYFGIIEERYNNS